MIWTNFRYSARSLSRSPALTITLLLTITLGIGSNAAVFGFVRGLTTRDLPNSESNQAMSAAMARISMLLTSAAWAVFAVACINVATLLLARSSNRTRDSSVRMALGATRAEMFRQLLADAVLISLAGAAFGSLVARWTTQVVPSLLFEQDAEQLVFVLDRSATITASMACAAIMVVCGLAPLIEMRRDDSARVLRRESAGPSQLMRRLRAALVVLQMTCCCLLVVSAGILITGFRSALRTQTGHHLQHAILATVESQARFARPDAGLEYFREIEQAAQSMPETITTAWSSVPPGSRSGSQSVRIVPPHPSLREVPLDVALFTRQSLEVVNLPPTAGRMFGAADTAQSCHVVVINEAARDLLGHDVVGERILDFAGRDAEILGVVAATEVGRTLGVRPTVYYYPDQALVSPDRIGLTRFRVPGDMTRKRGVLETYVLSPMYFDVMGLTVTLGTPFSPTPLPGCRLGLVNEEANSEYFGGHAIGGAIIDGSGHRTNIIGVVHSPPLRASQRQAEPAIYLPMTQDFLPRMTLIIRSRDASAATIASLRSRLDGIPGGKSPAIVTTLEAHLSRIALAPERIATVLIGASAAIALLLGGVGLYGAMADAVRQRRREFGVRLALGSPGWRLVNEVLGEGARLAAAGTMAGLLLSWLVARWLSEISPSADPPPVWIWAAAPVALLVAVLIASVLPARLALATDPLTVMRDE
jgi:ABC-type antimicrobial peptide transport system permease subunit